MAGAVFASDVSPYESLKLRLLNGSHSALAYLGLLAGYDYVAEFIEVDGVPAFVRALMSEAAATVSAPSSVDVDDYQQQLLLRFANPGLQHRLAQIAIDGSQKLPPRIVATVRLARAAGVQPIASVLGIAAWMRYVTAGHDDAGRPLAIDDPLAPRIASAGRARKRSRHRLSKGCWAWRRCSATWRTTSRSGICWSRRWLNSPAAVRSPRCVTLSRREPFHPALAVVGASDLGISHSDSGISQKVGRASADAQVRP